MPTPDRGAARKGPARRGRRTFAVALLLFAVAFSSFAQSKPDALKLYLAGKYDAARRVCIDELAADPNNIESYVVISWSLLALQRWADAENYALKGYAIRRDPRLSECLGESAFYLGRNDAALKDFQNYVSSIPEGGRAGNAYYFMGEIYLRLARYDHADIAFSTALQYLPDNARWWARMGWAREKGGDRRGARDAYRKALQLDPNLKDASNGLDRLSTAAR
jgi:tetratricopeptide (TPR) repeat protein